MAHFPPGYPALLALCGAGPVRALDRVRLLHAALFAVEGGLVAWLAARLGGSGAALLALPLFASPAMVRVHAMAWSEPLFLAALLLALGLAGRRDAPTGSIAACLALALLTRYAGLAFVPAVSSGTAAFRRRDWTAAARIAGLALLPLGLWLLRNLGTTGSAVERPLALHPIGADHLRHGLAAAAELSGSWLAAGLVTLATLAAVARWRAGADVGPQGAAERLLVACAGSYVLFLTASISLVDADTPLDVRVLAPFHALLVPLLAAAPFRAQLGAESRRAWCAVLAFAGALSLLGTAREAPRLGGEGQGFETRYWTDSPTVAALRALPSARLVVTNGPEIAAFLAGRRGVSDVPLGLDRVSLRQRPAVAREVEALCARLRAGAVLAWFHGVSWRWEAVPLPDLQEACGLVERDRLPDGVLLVAPDAG